MDIWTLLRITARRWYASVPVLLAGLGMSLYLFDNVEPVYTAESTAILTPPSIYEGEEPDEIIEVNPFLNLGGSLNTTTEVMVVLMDSTAKRFEYEERGLEPEYEVDRNDAVMYFEVTGSDPEAVITTATELVRIADVEMATLQGDPAAPTEERVTAVPLSLPAEAEEDALVGLRFVAVVAALAVGLAVVFAVLVDVMLNRRKERRTAGAADVASRDSGPDDDTRPADDGASAAPVGPAAEPAAASMPSPRAPDARGRADAPDADADAEEDADERDLSDTRAVREPA